LMPAMTNDHDGRVTADYREVATLLEEFSL
jgi:hypothetical protein